MTLRVLYITRVFPFPAHAGDLQYTAGLISALSAHSGIDLTVFCGAGLPASLPSGSTVWRGSSRQPGRLADFRALVGFWPRAAERALTSEAIRKLRSLVQSGKFDLAVVNEAATVKAISVLKSFGIPIVYVSHNVESDIRPMIASRVQYPLLGLLQRIDARKYQRAEMMLLRSAKGITAITGEDGKRYRELGYAGPIIVLRPGYNGDRLPVSLPCSQRERVAVLVGSFEWNAKILNLRLLLDAFRRFRAANNGSSFRLRVAGRISSNLHRRLKSEFPEVEIVGSFGELQSVIGDTRIALVLEEVGGGFKLKTLDYVFSNIAIVAFQHAMRGTDLIPGQDYLSVNSVDEAMHEIERVIDDCDLLSHMAGSSFNKMKELYDWDRRSELFFQLCRGVIENSAS